MTSTVKNYNRTLRAIHWLSAITIIAIFALGIWMMSLTYYSEWYQIAPFWHKSAGITLAGLTLFRAVWKALTPSPETEGKPYEKAAAKAAHRLIYLMLLIIFVSGYLISTSDGRGIDVFGWFIVPGLGELFDNQSDIAGSVHYYVAVALIGMAGLHAAAAVKHHFINRDNTLKKMIGKVK